MNPQKRFKELQCRDILTKKGVSKMLNVRRNRIAVLLAMLTAILMMFAGCGSSESTGTTGNANVNSEASSPVSSEEDSPGETTESFTALLTFANYEYIESGDASEEKLLRKISRTVSLSSADEAVQIEAAIQALASLPADVDGAETFVGQNIAVKSVEISGSTAVVDLEENGLDEASMYDEEFFIYQVTDTILNSFRDITGVRFTVEGTNTDSLNYMDISSPFTAADISEFMGDSASGSDENKSVSSDSKKTTDSSENTDSDENSNDNENGNSGSTGSGTAASDSSTSNASSGGSSSDPTDGQSASGTSTNTETPEGVVNDPE